MLKSSIWKKAPTAPGVYMFLRKGRSIYIGKAADLKKRLSSYWRKNAGEKTRLMMREATKLNWIETESEIEALLKEAEFIKKYRPKYNILMRDDKNYFYVGMTGEQFPRIFITHQPRAVSVSVKNLDLRTKQTNRRRSSKFLVLSSYIGPFTSGTALYSTLRLLRRIFPYCTCSRPHKRSCLNAQIGRCPGYCCFQPNVRHTNKLENVGMLDHTKKEYRKNISNINAVLEGKRRKILSKLRQEMRAAARAQNFELAAKLRDQIWGLENIFSHRGLLEVRPPAGSRTSTTVNWSRVEKFMRTLLGTKYKISRVEGYDISNISGTEATGSMVVFMDGIPAKSEYRKFRIKTVRDANDIAMHKEVMRRRLKHPEWPYPNLMIIDGGIAQLHAARAAITNHTQINSRINSNKKTCISDNSSKHSRKISDILLVALAKREEELYTDNRQSPISLKTTPPTVMHFFQHVRDESHRFAKKYHHKLREISYREERA